MPAAATVDERGMKALVTGYTVSYRSGDARYFFRAADPGSGGRGRWIWPSLPDGATPTAAVTMLLEAYREAKPVEVVLADAVGSYRGESLYRIVEVTRSRSFG